MPTAIHIFVGLWLTAWPAGPTVAPPPPAAVSSTTPLAAASDPDEPSLPSVDIRRFIALARTSDARAPLLDLTDEELLKWLESDPGALGSLSIGAPGGAVLFNAVQLLSSSRWQIAANAQTWATPETIDYIQTAVDTVYDLFPDTPPIVIGDISDPEGGRLKRHKTHQAGRDVDFGFYYKGGQSRWYIPGTAANLDLPRNWALLRALVTRTDVERIFLDTRIQRLLYKYALGIGEEQAWLDRVFQFSRGLQGAIVQHVKGHRTHYHVRFYNQVAQELGRRAQPMLVQLNIIAPPVSSVRHIVRRGQTIAQIAARYGTSVRAIMDTNGLKTTRLRAGRSYRIPVRAAIPPSQPIVVPDRVLPSQTPSVLASVDWPLPH